jgi:hypothetical protein
VLPLKVAVGIVQKTLIDYQHTSNHLPKLSSAEFDFKVQSEHTEGLGFGIWIITIGGSRTADNVSDLTFTYAVPTPTPASSGPSFSIQPLNVNELKKMDVNALANMDSNLLSGIDINTFADILAAGTATPKLKVDKLHDQLLAAIEAAANAVKDAPTVGAAKFSTFAAQIQYAIKYDGKVEANIPIFSFFSISPKVDINQTAIQSVKLVFKPPSATPSPTASASASSPSP